MEAAHGIIVVRDDSRTRLEPLMRLSAAERGGTTGAETLEGGRARPLRLPVKGLPGSVLVRPYAHGGLLGGLLGTRFAGPGRALRELAVAVTATGRGLPVPEMLGFTASRAGPLWTMEAWVRWIEAAPPLHRVLEAAPDERIREQAMAGAGRAVRACHDAGLVHHDLNSRNILVAGGPAGFRALVVDLDGARMGPPPGTTSRARQLRRLFRSLVKERAMPAGGAEFASLLRGYGAPFNGPAGSPLVARARLETRLHSLFWKGRKIR